jgi:hypothetical protein
MREGTMLKWGSCNVLITGKATVDWVIRGRVWMQLQLPFPEGSRGFGWV